MLDRWVETGYQPVIPIQAPAHEMFPERAEFGQFSRKQREWLLRRDTDPESGLVRCQFQGNTPNGEWTQCPIDEQKAFGRRHMHAHHIVPQGWWDRWFQFGEESESPNQPWNGIILCEMFHHNGERGIHPDFARARTLYRFDQDIYKKVAQEHHRLIELQIPYWEEKYDQILYEIAIDRTEEYLKDHSEDVWPKD